MRHRQHISHATGFGLDYERTDWLVRRGLLTDKEAARVGARMMKNARAKGLTVRNAGFHTIEISWTKLDGTKAVRRYGWGKQKAPVVNHAAGKGVEHS